ncbi:MAG: SUMF1/EgtB/PvdO family nonheme iron enzyme [Planctomycetia bacterium]|nr:SUMF1/EgtB/PvdO family nonheme iron enzyme [Planctomycetia bacterium]
MKKLWILSFFALLPSLLFADEAVRTWKSKTGKTIIEAKWDSENDPDVETVFFFKEGKRFKYAFEKLSDEDQKYVSDGRKKRARRGVGEGEKKNPWFEMPKARKFALLVGVTDYVHMNELACCVKDVVAIREQLLRLGFKPADIYTLESGKKARDLPTRENIRSRLDVMLKQVRTGDVVFFVFAGHGAENGTGAYICPTYADTEDLEETCIPISEIMEKMNASDAKFKCLVVDACRNNPFYQQTAGITSLRHIDDPPPAMVVLQSCRQNEYSLEDKDTGLSLFSASFVEALSGKADADGDGSLTLMEVYKYTTEETNRKAIDRYREPQNPYLRGDMTDVILFHDLDRPKAIAYFDAARKLRREKKYDEAKAEIDKALELYPEDMEYLDEQGIIASLIETEKARKKAEAGAEQIPPISSGSTAGERMVKMVNGVEYAFRWCPAGSFMMGSPDGELYRFDDEGPQHYVTLTSGFWILETEVTQRMWQSMMGESIEARTLLGNDDERVIGSGPNHPMYYIDWHSCQEFCQKLSSKLGSKVNLPSEAQWEYACRAGTTTSLNSGKTPRDSRIQGACENICEVAWYWENGGRGASWQDLDMPPYAAKLKKPNAWGIFDMHGNVSEWCADWYGESYYQGAPKYDPTGPSSGSDRVVRGGSWSSLGKGCRSASRSHNVPTDRSNLLGFRPVLVP